MSTQFTDRLWSKVNKTDTCWLWTAATDSGYGKFKVGGGMRPVHRVVYELLVGPIAEGLELDHLCRVRHCVNPDHLEPVTHRENQVRGWGVMGTHYRKTHCAQGHEFTPENTIVRIRNGNESRRCRECNRIRCKQRYAQRTRAAREESAK